jgi:hypothetical protein
LNSEQQNKQKVDMDAKIRESELRISKAQDTVENTLKEKNELKTELGNVLKKSEKLQVEKEEAVTQLSKRGLLKG